MAFNAREMSVLAYANGFTLWHYRTPDPAREITQDYFADAGDVLRGGDMIILQCVGDGRSGVISIEMEEGEAPRVSWLVGGGLGA